MGKKWIKNLKHVSKIRYGISRKLIETLCSKYRSYVNNCKYPDKSFCNWGRQSTEAFEQRGCLKLHPAELKQFDKIFMKINYFLNRSRLGTASATSLSLLLNIVFALFSNSSILHCLKKTHLSFIHNLNNSVCSTERGNILMF